MNATTRFTDRVADYVRARPGYPAQVVDVLRERCGLSPAWPVADVGAGTGISSQLLLDAGYTVVAVEPNRAMRDACQQALGHHPRFGVLDGAAEATGIADGAVRLVLAAQAFHWFDRAAFRRECARILAPGGWVALLWNDRQIGGSAFLDRYERLLHRYGTDYAKVNHRNVADAGVADFFAPCGFDRVTFPNVQRFDFDLLKARLLSSSYAPNLGSPGADAMLAELREIFDDTQHDGIVEMTYQTQLFFGQLS